MSAITGLFTGNFQSTSSSALGAAQAGVEVGRQAAEKVQIDNQRKLVLQGLKQITAALRLIGPPPTRTDIDGRIAAEPATLFQRIDQAAASDTLVADRAFAAYNSAVRELRSRLGTIPNPGRTQGYLDAAAMAAAREALARAAQTTGDDQIKEAARTGDTRLNLAEAGKRREARERLADVAAELEAAREIYTAELTSIELRGAGLSGAIAAAKTASSGNGLFGAGAAPDLGVTFADRRRDVSLKDKLTDLSRRLARIGQIVGDPQPSLNAARPFAFLPLTMHDWLDRAQLEDNAAENFRSDAIVEFNRLRSSILTQIRDLPDVISKGLLDQDAITQLLQRFDRFTDTRAAGTADPNALREAVAVKEGDPKPDDKFDFNRFGDDAGKTLERSEARRVLNELTLLTRELQNTVATELTSLSARISGYDASITAITGGGGRVGSAVSVSGTYQSAKRSVSSALKGLDRLIEQVGQPQSDLLFEGAPVKGPKTLQDALTNTINEATRTNAVTDFNTILADVRKELRKLPNLPTALLQDGDLAATLMNAVDNFDSALSTDRLRDVRAVFASGQTGDFYDVGRPGDTDGTNFRRSHARRSLNQFYDALTQARQALDRELVSLSIQADISKAQADASITALSAGGGGALTGALSALTSRGSAESPARLQTVQYLREVTKVKQAIGRPTGAFGSDGTARERAFTQFQRVDQASDETKRAQAISSFNTTLSDIERAGSRTRRVGGIGLIDRDGLERARVAQRGITGTASAEQVRRADGTAFTVRDLRLQPSATSEGNQLSLAKAGNAAGDDLGRSEARRALSNALAATNEYRTRLLREVFNQDSIAAAAKLTAASATAAYTRALADDANAFSRRF